MSDEPKMMSMMIDPDSRAKLAELAQRHMRTLSGEVRWLIQAAHEVEFPAPQPSLTQPEPQA